MFMALTSLLFAQGLVVAGGALILDAFRRLLCVGRYAESARDGLV